MVTDARDTYRRRRACPNEVPDYRRLHAHVERTGAPFDFTVGESRALVLAQVLGPGVDYEGLDDSRRVGRVAVEAPVGGAIAPPQPAHVAMSDTITG